MTAPFVSDEQLEQARATGREASEVLKALPADLDTGYSDDEVAAQYAATNRLLAAFRELDLALIGRSVR